MADEEATTTSRTSKDLVDLGKRHAFYTNRNGDRFNLVALHRMNMHYLRKRLLDQAAVVFGNGEMTDKDSELLTSLMRDYCMFLSLLSPRVSALWNFFFYSCRRTKTKIASRHRRA